ncbi:hypothetical protein QMP26_13215 [Enterocloster clostridioformis]|uniref:hypothetical protein n=1 Tax=Enterocloster clostridioformis TaxID=1531 RepID=UPI002676BBE5|nr:hypothetical protein [Enterocloster clostridioformis]
MAMYVLSKGILEMECKVENDIANGPAWNDTYYGEGREWHRTPEAAIKRAEEMRAQKIKTLKNQIEKLKKLNFH